MSPLLAVSLSALLLNAGPAVEDGSLVAEVGERRIVMADGYQGLRYFPDEPIGIISRRPLLFTLVAGNSTVLMRGEDLFRSVPLGTVLGPTGHEGDYDSDYAGISSVHIDSRRREILGFYHAERHRKGTTSYTGGPKWYGTIGLAVSRDGGRSFQKIGPIITSVLPFDPNSDRTAQGVGDVSVIVDRTKTYFYAYYTEHSRIDGRSVIICMARSRLADGGRPGTWKKLLDGQFVADGLGGKDTQVANLYGPNVTLIPSLDKYVMVGNRDFIHFCESDDGIHWSDKKVLVRDGESVPLPGRPTAMRAHLQITRSDSRSASGYLLYTYSPSWGEGPNRVPHYFVMRPITFRLKGHGSNGNLGDKLSGTRWRNTNGATFDWTRDGRLLHNGTDRSWEVTGERTVRVTFGPQHEDLLEFDKDFTEFKQLIRGGPDSFIGRQIPD